MNDYHDLYRSAREFWADFERELDEEHRTVVHNKDGSVKTRDDGTPVTRAFRKDGVPLTGVVLNPPDEVSEMWDASTYDRFVFDSMVVLEEFEPKLFSRSHVRAWVTHYDEGGNHDHIAYDAFDAEGRCNGNLLDAKLLHELCEFYPAAMRERGWDLEDLDVTDWERMRTDSEYAAERREKLREGRANTKEYVRRQNERRAAEALELAVASEQRSLQLEADAECLRHELSVERVRHDALIEEQKERALIAHDYEVGLRESELLELSRRLEAANRDMKNVLAQARNMRRERDRCQAEIDRLRKQAEAVVSEAQAKATRIANDAADIELKSRHRIRQSEEALDERERDLDEREMLVADREAETSLPDVLSAFVDSCGRFLPWLDASVLDAMRGHVGRFLEDWHEEHMPIWEVSAWHTEVDDRRKQNGSTFSK